MAREATSLGFTLKSRDRDRDVNTQSKQIDDFIAMKVLAVVGKPVDRVAIGPATKAANEAG